MLLVKIKNRIFEASDVDTLRAEVRSFILENDFGASDVGSIFSIYRDGNVVADLCYNGKFNWRDEAYAS